MKSVVAILGPTASGKSALGMQLARTLGYPCEIICCDSVQVYRGMDICSGKPTAEDRREVPHHMLDVVRPDEHFHASMWADGARAAIAGIVGRGALPVIVGGTGLYFRALAQGFFEAPPPDPQIRARHQDEAARVGTPVLHARLKEIDPDAAARIMPNDLLRTSRALEIFEQTGRPISQLQKEARPAEAFDFFTVVLEPPMPTLVPKIETRIKAMLAAGLMDEVARLKDAGYVGTRAFLSALGYTDLLAALEGGVTLAEAVLSMTSRTVAYARRQRTWFRKEAARLRLVGDIDVPTIAEAIRAWRS